MRIIAKGYCSDEVMSWGQCAVIELGSGTIEGIKKLRAVLNNQHGIAQVVAWDTSVVYYRDGLDEDGPLWTRLDADGYLVLDPDEESPLDDDDVEALSTESEAMHVDRQHVWWRAHVRHGDAFVETGIIPLEDLDCPIHWGDDAAQSLCLWCIAGTPR